MTEVQEKVGLENQFCEFMTDGKGNQIRKENIKDLDLLRDELVKRLHSGAKQVSQIVSDFKSEAQDEVNAFVELAANEHGVALGGRKGNVSLMSFDGNLRIQHAQSDIISFNEQLLAAKTLIAEAIKDMSEGVSSDLLAIVNKAFEVDKNGNVSTARVLGLRTIKIGNIKWNKAMEIISESIQIDSTKSYLRFHKRSAAGDWVLIDLSANK